MFPYLPLTGLCRPFADLDIAGFRIGIGIVPLLVNHGIAAIDLHGLDGLPREGETGRASLCGKEVFEAGEDGIYEFGIARDTDTASPEGRAVRIGGKGSEVWKNLLVWSEVLPAAQCFFLFHGLVPLFWFG